MKNGELFGAIWSCWNNLWVRNRPFSESMNLDPCLVLMCLLHVSSIWGSTTLGFGVGMKQHWLISLGISDMSHSYNVKRRNDIRSFKHCRNTMMFSLCMCDSDFFLLMKHVSVATSLGGATSVWRRMIHPHLAPNQGEEQTARFCTLRMPLLQGTAHGGTRRCWRWPRWFFVGHFVGERLVN